MKKRMEYSRSLQLASVDDIYHYLFQQQQNQGRQCDSSAASRARDKYLFDVWNRISFFIFHVMKYTTMYKWIIFIVSADFIKEIDILERIVFPFSRIS